MTLRWCALACVMAFAAAAAEVIEVSLQYVKSADAEFHIPRGGTRMELQETPERPMQLPDLPEALVRYATFSLGETVFQVALARTENKEAPEESFFKYALYVDTPGGMVEVGVDRCEGDDEFSSVRFDEQDFEYRIGENMLPMAVAFRFSESEVSSFVVSTAAGYAGEFELYNQKYHVILGDGEMSGHIGEKITLFDGHHRFRGNAIGIMTADGITDKWRFVTATDYVHFQGRLYELAIDVPNGKLTLSPFDGPTVPLKIPEETKTLQIYDFENNRSVAVLYPEGDVSVPAGSYRVLEYTVNRTEAAEPAELAEPAGAAWRLAARATQYVQRRFSKKAGAVWLLTARATAETPLVAVGPRGGKIAFGEPYTVKLEETTLRRMPGGYRLYMHMTGSAQEEVIAVERIGGGETEIPMANHNRPKSPTYRIANEDSEVIAAGIFEYG